VFQNLAKDSYFDAIACFILVVVAIIGLVLSRTRIALVVPAAFSMISFGLFCAMIIWNGDAHGAGFLFIFIYPMLTIILFGSLKGIIFSAVLFAIVVVEFFVPGVARFVYHIDLSLRMVAVYLLILGITLVFEASRKTKDRMNDNLTQEIIEMNQNLQAIVEERTEKIIKLQNAILKTMSNFVEYRDVHTGEHDERTQYHVRLLLTEMKKRKAYPEIINDWDIDLIMQSVQLHDIGKIAISDTILNKQTPLTKDEYEEMKKHAFFGYKIIERMEEDSGESELLTHAKLFALTHHERWDGTGYPHGLKGSNIPLQGRIMAIADVYDALVSERPYKKAFSHDEAVKIISDGKGSQFDPELIELFIITTKNYKQHKMNMYHRAV
jgi:response regulator RpfG family c-di-GMP phosphodiesterase